MTTPDASPEELDRRRKVGEGYSKLERWRHNQRMRAALLKKLQEKSRILASTAVSMDDGYHISPKEIEYIRDVLLPALEKLDAEDQA